MWRDVLSFVYFHEEIDCYRFSPVDEGFAPFACGFLAMSNKGGCFVAGRFGGTHPLACDH